MPKMKRNKPASKIDMEVLREDIRSYPDAYLYERAELFESEQEWHMAGVKTVIKSLIKKA